MRIYKVIIGDEKFDYEYLTDKINLLELNNLIQESNKNKKIFIDEYLPLLTNIDVVILKTGGGTIIYKRNNGDFVYLIDLDFKRSEKSFPLYDNELYKKFDSIRDTIKRDIQLDKILN